MAQEGRKQYSVTGGANGCRHPRVSPRQTPEGPPPPGGAVTTCHQARQRLGTLGGCTGSHGPRPCCPPAPSTALRGGSSHPQGQAAQTQRRSPCRVPVTTLAGVQGATPGQVTPWLLSPAGAAGHRGPRRKTLSSWEPQRASPFPFRPRSPLHSCGQAPSSVVTARLPFLLRVHLPGRGRRCPWWPGCPPESGTPRSGPCAPPGGDRPMPHTVFACR